MMRLESTCPTCKGDKKVETLHPQWGSRSCPEPYIEATCPDCKGDGTVDFVPDLLELLDDIAGFLDESGQAPELYARVEDAIDRVQKS